MVNKMTQKGLNELNDSLTELIKKFNDNEKKMTMAYHNSDGDGAHDNAEFEELLANERMLANQIDNLKKRIESIELFEVQDLDEDKVNVDDTIKIKMVYDIDDEEILDITLVGGDGDSICNKISVNSPLGNAIYTRNIGDSVYYEVNGLKVRVDILEKVNKVYKK